MHSDLCVFFERDFLRVLQTAQITLWEKPLYERSVNGSPSRSVRASGEATKSQLETSLQQRRPPLSPRPRLGFHIRRYLRTRRGGPFQLLPLSETCTPLNQRSISRTRPHSRQSRIRSACKHTSRATSWNRLVGRDRLEQTCRWICSRQS